MTGLNGKNWLTELNRRRVVWLSQYLREDGRGLDWDALHNTLMEQLPGGRPIKKAIIKKVAYGVERGINPRTWSEALSIMLPQGPNAMKRWEQEREKRRIEFINQRKSKMLVTQETSVGGIRQALGKLPKEVEESLDQLKVMLKSHHYRKLEIDLHEDGKAHIMLEPMPQSIITVL